MAVRLQHPRLSPAEFAALQDDHGWSVDIELIGGEPVVIPPDDSPASSAQGELYFQARRWQERYGAGGLLLQDVFVELDATTTLGPDVAWWSPARRPPIAAGPIKVVPDWVAEVLSPSTRENDLGPKHERYLASGVRELWLVDPTARSVAVVDATGRATVAGIHCRSLVLTAFRVETAALFVD